MASAVQLQKVAVRFTRDQSTVTAFEDVSLEVEPGELVTIIGPSGCGKSTLLRVVADLLPCCEGRVEVFGEPPDRARNARKVGFVFQDATLLPWRTALDNVRLPLEVGGWRARGTPGPSPATLFRLIGLEGREGAFPQELSGGQRQRLSIARALISSPSILLMDEPFGALDEITRDRLNEELLRIWRETKTTILFVTHSLVEAAYLGQRVVVMATDPGRIVRVVDLAGEKPGNTISRHDPAFFRMITQLRRLLEEHAVA
jgi:NitT/TauT family transport system ATP-binding protein